VPASVDTEHTESGPMVESAAGPLRKRRPKRDAEAAMPLVEHLKELRNRLGKAILAIAAFTVGGWFVYDHVFAYLTKPFRQVGIDHRLAAINFNTPVAAFTVRFHVALFVGVVVSSPLWLYQLWAFVAPGLKRNEKKYAYAFIGTAFPLFALGAGLALYVMPITMGALLSLAPKNSAVLNDAGSVIDFAVRLALAFGIMFVIPVLLVGLNLIGVVSGQTLKRTWRVAVFVVFVAAAIASPSPDPLTMLLLAIPVAALYLAAMAIALAHDKRKAKRSTEPDYSQFADDEATPIEKPAARR